MMDKNVKDLVLWRLERAVPGNFKLSIGNKGSFNKEELKKHVEAEDEIGVAFTNMQLNFIKALTSGEFSRKLAETEVE
jgi:hypothetical protein